jgi:hypothetical protein
VGSTFSIDFPMARVVQKPVEMAFWNSFIGSYYVDF